MIRAYPHDPSVEAGEELVLHVKASSPFTIRFHRSGARYERVGPEYGPFSSERVCIRIPQHWRPGAYVADFWANDARPPPSPDARDSKALFVIRSRRARIVVNLPLFTYHAYNCVEPSGECLYTGPTRVSLHRPGGGTGAHLWDERYVDVYDPSTPRQTFEHWDAKGIAWLERAGFEPAICTDLDLDAGVIPARARLLIAFGHFEYWTRGMRTSVERFLRSGGNVALFCGNTSRFRITYDARKYIIARDGKWSDDDPEEELLGTSYRFGGGCWGQERPATGLCVKDPSHWAFAGTGLRAGDEFGANSFLVGYECDGAALAQQDDIAFASIRRWNVDANGEILGGRASMVVRNFTSGTLFNVGTVDWARVLELDRDGTVERITHNVVSALS